MELRDEMLEMSDKYSGRIQELFILAVARIDRLEAQIKTKEVIEDGRKI